MPKIYHYLIIAGIVLAGAVIAWLLLRNRNRATFSATAPVRGQIIESGSNPAVVAAQSRTANVNLSTFPTAPGVSPITGTVPTPPPPPPPPGMASQIVRNLSPSGALQNIPIVGKPAVAITKAATNTAFTAASRINSTVGNVLSNVPIAGKFLAAPTKVVGGAVNAAKSIFNSIF